MHIPRVSHIGSGKGEQSKPGGGNKATSEGIFLVRREIV